MSIPAPLPTDAEDVSWALSTAQSLWTRNERADAVVWVKRASKSAALAQDDDRAIELARAAASLSDALEAAAPPAAGTDEIEIDMEEAPPSIMPLDEAELVEAAPAPAPAKPPPRKPPPPPKSKMSAAPPPVEEVLSSIPPSEAFDALEPVSLAPAAGDGASAPTPPPVVVAQEPAQAPATAIPALRPPTPDEDDEDGPLLPPTPPAPLAYSLRSNAGTVPGGFGTHPLPAKDPIADDHSPAKAKHAAITVDGDLLDETPPPQVVRTKPPSAPRQRVTVQPAPKHTGPSQFPPPAPAADPSRSEPPPAKAKSEPPRPRPKSEPPPRPNSEPPAAGKPLSEPPPAATPEELAPADSALAAGDAATAPDSPTEAHSEPPAAPTPKSDPPPRAKSEPPPRPRSEPPPPPPPRAESEPPPPPVAAKPKSEPPPAKPQSDPALAAAKPSPPKPPKPPPPRGSMASVAGLAPRAAVVAAFSGTPPLAPLADLVDLPDAAREDLEKSATIVHLTPGVERAGFGLAFVIDGHVDVAVVGKEPCSRLTATRSLRAHSSLGPTLDLKLVGTAEGGNVAVWTPEQIDETLKACPWVEFELASVSDAVHAVAGGTSGPMSTHLDASLRTALVSSMAVRAVAEGEVVAAPGETVPGLFVPGVGTLELFSDEKTYGTVGAGEFLFAMDVLGGAKAQRGARGGKGGALVLFAERKTVQDLILKYPPLLNLLTMV